MEPVTILMPCRAQRREFFCDAVRSVVEQTSPDWRLSVIVDADSPPELGAWTASFADPRIALLVSDGGFARALNLGMRHATTEWVAILLSDDRLDRRAIEVLHRHIAAAPEVDFFHSARQNIDAEGRPRTVSRPTKRVTVDAFRTSGSPVKHLLCWRRRKGLEIGGMDEEQTLVGCDDYDFPWRMLEAGCRFRAIPDTLYGYRVHHAAERLTVDVPLRRQLGVLQAMFRKHGVSPAETCAYLQRALDGYLVKELLFDFEDNWRARVDVACHREAGPERLPDFLGKGWAQRHFFPHRVYQLPKGGPDGLKLAWRMCGVDDPARLAQLVLYALPPTLDELPADLFFDSDIQWHRQHYGRPGQVASANLVRDRDVLVGMVYHSDLVQRVPRRREHKTRIEKRLKGWHRLLLNALLNVALDLGVRWVKSPSAAFAMFHTDPARTVAAPLFTRVYDTAVEELYAAERDGDWWRIDVAANRDRVVLLDKDAEVTPTERTICVCHDIERGHGHRATDPGFAALADAAADGVLDRMLEIERRVGIRATYNVLGLILDAVRARIVRDGHACGFHSYDHPEARRRGLVGTARRLVGPRTWDDGTRQLGRCREVDYRLKGYRPPHSRIGPGLDRNLGFHGFEWLASSAYSLGFETPRMQNGIVKIPILFDDHEMFARGVPFEAWARKALDAIDAHPFVAFSLHDCYADRWLDHYEEFLRALRERGRFRTLDEVAAEVTFGHARWT